MSNESPYISVCIVTYQRDRDLLISLQHLAKSTYQDYEILIVDNGPSKELPQLLENAGITRPWRLIQAAENRGCANLNLLFTQARGKVIACFDDDSYPAPDCLALVSNIFSKDPEMGMIGFKMHLPETGEPWHDPWWNPNESKPRSTVLCPGCGLAFRNDERLPAEICIPDIVSQAHELSMAAEITRLGYKIEFHPECIAFHPDTTVGYKAKKADSGNQNQLRFLVHYSDSLTLKLLVLTHWLVRLRGLPNHYDFLTEYIKQQKRTRALPRKVMARFREVLLWHTHPRLQRFLPQ